MVLLRTRAAAAADTDRKLSSKKSEPATDDEPVSSTEEEISDVGGLSDDDHHGFGDITPRRVGVGSGPTLEQKLAAAAAAAAAAYSDNNNNNNYNNNNNNSGNNHTRSSQRSIKKRKPIGYQSKNGRKSDSFQKGSSFVYGSPSSSAPVHSQSASFSPLHQLGQSQTGNDHVEETERNGFRVPIDTDLEISSSRAVPEVLGFKQPPELPPASISSSSLFTSSAFDIEIHDSDDDSPLSSAVSCASLEEFVNECSRKTQYLCPMCKEPVAPALLVKFQAQPRQRIRDQQVFCESHKKSSAEKEWEEKGYPTIDWENFHERIRTHFDDLEKRILVPDSPSYYRNVLDTALKSGQAKNFRLTLSGDVLETISCGYYGTRGSGKMLQAITARFARKLRHLAADDHIVKKAGVVVYSQAVLVPELAVRLVKEDMGVDDESARQILRESIEIGEKLNFALSDSVPVTEKADELS
ncbi:hypothetical protein P175DRAFT_0478522 [Aspergillus ochraceoroseus IBT 24754]|uniref:Restriction of telomere capping protein 4 n=1 Tax=Aspergillus ochraceoroseus IBT 24754 TaxID=1392256 RepID=A0A2T5LWA8_9EURO|nr:uncharacterized protein P175DRAFT_0478522 [Aspergillus ochraceoroseus IBT 24754]PTU20570.1 hypothetical protein P175DRAFT_0478522 [Aspergillus ochraceoroseus IBT 24754]